MEPSHRWFVMFRLSGETLTSGRSLGQVYTWDRMVGAAVKLLPAFSIRFTLVCDAGGRSTRLII